MRYRLLILVLCFHCISSIAQAAPLIFSDLSWKDSVKTVDRKLRAAGFSGCKVSRQLECRMSESCSCEFEGPALVNASAAFQGNKLVMLNMAVSDPVAVRQVLTKKHGAPVTFNKTIGGTANATDGPRREQIAYTWASSNGDRIELTDSLLDYYSGSYLKAQDGSNSKPSPF